MARSQIPFSGEWGSRKANWGIGLSATSIAMLFAFYVAGFGLLAGGTAFAEDIRRSVSRGAEWKPVEARVEPMCRDGIRELRARSREDWPPAQRDVVGFLKTHSEESMTRDCKSRVLSSPKECKEHEVDSASAQRCVMRNSARAFREVILIHCFWANGVRVPEDATESQLKKAGDFAGTKACLTIMRE